MNKLTISISGPVGSGKTTIGRLIQKTLEENNITIDNYKDEDGDFNMTNEHLRDRIGLVSKKSTIDLFVKQPCRACKSAASKTRPPFALDA
jgi:uridine kinase